MAATTAPADAAEPAAGAASSLTDAAASFITGIGNGPREALAFGFVAAAIILAVGVVALAIAATRGTGRIIVGQRRRIRSLEAEVAEARGVIAAEPHILLRWKGAADPEPTVTGTLGTECGVPDDADRVRDTSSWLDRASQAALESAVNDLRSVGTAFSLFATTRSGTRLVAEGFPSAGAAMVKFRALVGSSLQAVAEADRAGAHEQEAASLKAVLAKAPVLAWIRGRDGQLRWVNAAYAEAVEAETPDAAVAGEVELIPPEARRALADAIGRGTTARQRVHAVTGGTRRAYDVIDVPSPLGDTGIAIDVTEADRLADELDRHIAAHGRTLDQLATAVAIFGSDQRLNFFNAAYVDLWRLDEAWLRQEPTDGEILDNLRDQGRLPEQADYRKWRNDRLKVYTALETVEEWWHLPDGQSLRAVVEPHPFGGVTHLYENVTEKIALASRYNTLFSVQRETLDNLHEGVALFGSDGRLKLSNPSFASIWQLGPEDLENEPHMDTIIATCRRLTETDDHWVKLRASITAFGGERQPIEGRITRPDGIVVDYASVPLPDGATLFTYVDVTDSWRIEQALRERNEALLAADRLKTAFISHVSYELRAPLTNIIGFADMLAAETFGPVNDKQAEYVSYIQRSSQKLHQLIDDILDLATIDAGVMELDADEIDIDATLRATGALLAERIEAAGITLEYDIPDGIGTIVADETRLKQILFNLLTNAIGFSPADTAITVGVRRLNGDVEIWVADQGPGIAPELHERVFERFETHTEGSSHRGSGLGLSVVKSFVELHGGTVEIESERGQGTAVRFRLPSRPAGLDASDGRAEREAVELDPALPSP